jgi:beta-glucanase (GH16 family)
VNEGRISQHTLTNRYLPFNKSFMQKTLAFLLLCTCSLFVNAQKVDAYKPDNSAPKKISGMTLAWSDEFNVNGVPDSKTWRHEKGFVRNKELQWYQPQNAVCKNGLLTIEGRRERVLNPAYKEGSEDWRTARQHAEYTASSINTRGLTSFHYGRFEIRARVDTSLGSWPAIWTLGVDGRWPLNGEVDIMEFYRVNDTSTILANVAWGRDSSTGGPIWNTKRLPLSHFLQKDPEWPRKFHVWRMDWSADSILLYLDDELLNSHSLKTTLNPDGSNPFLQPQYILLNLAIGANGGDPSATTFPIKYEVDYVRYYKKD